MSKQVFPHHELPRWYVFADRLTPTSKPFFLGVGLERERYLYHQRPEAWHRYVKRHMVRGQENGDAVRTALEATRMTKRQAERQLRRLVTRYKPEIVE